MTLAAWFVIYKWESATFFLPSIVKMFEIDTTTSARRAAPKKAKQIVISLPGSVLGK